MAVTERPKYCVTMGTEDVTELVDLDSLSRSMTERGDGACTFDMPVSSENEVPTNQLVRDAVLRVTVDGATRYLGKVRNWTRDAPYVVAVEASGYWDDLHQNEAYCKGFVETRYDAFRFPIVYSRIAGETLNFVGATMDNDGQVLISLPSGTKYSSVPASVSYAEYQVQDGLGSGKIHNAVIDYAISGNNSAIEWEIVVGTYSIASGDCGAADSGTISTGELGAESSDMFQVILRAASDGTTTAECAIQIEDMHLYIDGYAAPRVNSAAAAIWTDITGDSATVTETIGSVLTQCMVDPFTDGADAITQVLAKATTPPLCGAIHGVFKCLARPTTPPDKSRLWVVSDQLTPGLVWGVQPDKAASKDYVALTYTQISSSPLFHGLPAVAYYPSTPTSKTDRVALVDSGTELTAAEAAAFAEQAYAYYHDLAQGTVTIPYVCHNGYGQESPCDHIECWDWIYNAGKVDPDEAGPFLISEVTHQGGIATLTIGATEGYSYESPYRLPTKSRYVGAHRQRYRFWSKSKRRPSGKGWHKSGKRWWQYRYRNVEGRYV